MVRLDPRISDIARQFVLVRVANMRGVNLRMFDFDFDLDWAALFMSAEGRTYGRFGGRDPDDPGKYLTMSALRYAMGRALELHRQRLREPERPLLETLESVERYPGALHLKPNSCIHCHQVHEYRREEAQKSGQWKKDDVWMFPSPENIGLELDPEQGNRILAVQPTSPAAGIGMKAGDVLQQVGKLPTASFADVQFALNRAPEQGELAIQWQRGASVQNGRLQLAAGWRIGDISWRASLRRLGSTLPIQGEDLNESEKEKHGLDARKLAFRPGSFLPRTLRQSGLTPNDIIVGANGQFPVMNARQFLTYLRLTQEPGDRIVIHVLRAGKSVDLQVQLPRPIP